MFPNFFLMRCGFAEDVIWFCWRCGGFCWRCVWGRWECDMVLLAMRCGVVGDGVSFVGVLSPFSLFGYGEAAGAALCRKWEESGAVGTAECSNRGRMRLCGDWRGGLSAGFRLLCLVAQRGGCGRETGTAGWRKPDSGGGAQCVLSCGTAGLGGFGTVRRPMSGRVPVLGEGAEARNEKGRRTKSSAAFGRGTGIRTRDFQLPKLAR